MLRVFTVDGIHVSDDEFDDEFQACEAMGDVTGGDIVIQVILGEDVYAEEIR